MGRLRCGKRDKEHSHLFCTIWPLFGRFRLAKGVAKLVGARSGTIAAGVSIEDRADLGDVFALDELGDCLQVAVTSADEVDMLDCVALDLNVDGAGANPTENASRTPMRAPAMSENVERRRKFDHSAVWASM